MGRRYNMVKQNNGRKLIINFSLMCMVLVKATVNEKLVSAPKMLTQRTRAGGIPLSLCHYLMTSS